MPVDAFERAIDLLGPRPSASQPTLPLEKYWDDPVAFLEEFIRWDGEHLTAYQREIIAAVPLNRRVSVRGPHGLGKCLAKDETIQLASGAWVKVQDCVGEGIQIHTLGGPKGAHVADNGVVDVVRITTEKGRVIRRTLNHPIWGDIEPMRWDAKVSCNRLRPKGEWVEAQNLVRGSVIAASLKSPEIPPYDIPDEAIKLAAMMLGDGNTSGNSVGFSQAPGLLLDEFVECCETLGSTVRQSSRYDFRVSSNWEEGGVRTLLREWDMLHHDSFDKSFPEWVWKLDRHQLGLFLSRLYACDGWASIRISEKNFFEIGYCTVSKKMAQEVQRALARLGINVALRKRKTVWAVDGLKRYGEAWNIAIHDSVNALRFTECIGIFGKEEALGKVERLARAVNTSKTRKWRNFEIPDGLEWEQIVSVRLEPAVQTYLIEVPDGNTFLTDFYEHNTTMMALIVWWFALTRDGLDWKVITTASSWRQLTKYLWPEIHKWARRIDWEKLGRPTISLRTELHQQHIRLTTGEAFAVASDVPEKIEGAHADYLLYIFDESKSIVSGTFDAAEGAFSGASALSTNEAYALAFSTPGEPVGRFFDIQSRRPGTEDWWVRHVTLDEAIESGQVTREWAEQRARQWGRSSAVYINRVEGNFAKDAVDGLIPLEWIENAQKRWFEAQDALPKFMCVGVDVARSGQDKTIFAPRFGNVIGELEEISGADTMEVTGRVVQVLNRFGEGYASVDVIGVGAGVVDRLREQGRDVWAFNASERSNQSDASGELDFVNVRAQAWWNLREMLDPHNNFDVALPPDDEMLGDLMAPRYRVMSGGRIQVESKDEIKKRLGRSPDRGDAVVMAMARRESASVQIYIIENDRSELPYDHPSWKRWDGWQTA